MNEEEGTSLNTEAQGSENAAGLRATRALIDHARTELGRVIAGQGAVIEEVLIAVLCQGHALIEGVPGIAKTLMVKTLGRLLGLGASWNRKRIRRERIRWNRSFIRPFATATKANWGCAIRM